MPRRVGLPGASELFRPTGELAPRAPVSRPEQRVPSPDDKPPRRVRPAPAPPADAEAPVVTGRVRHDEKITVYVSREELLALERLRLELRADHGLAVDRGRIVRAAIASALAQVGARGADADVVRRLAGS